MQRSVREALDVAVKDYEMHEERSNWVTHAGCVVIDLCSVNLFCSFNLFVVNYQYQTNQILHIYI